MTIATLRLTQPIETFYFDPPLPPAKEIQVVGYFGRFRSVTIFCDIVESLSSYSNYEKGEFGPSQLLAIIPSQEYPTVKVQKSKEPINSIKFLIMDEKRDPPNINENQPFTICLKIYH